MWNLLWKRKPQHYVRSLRRYLRRCKTSTYGIQEVTERNTTLLEGEFVAGRKECVRCTELVGGEVADLRRRRTSMYMADYIQTKRKREKVHVYTWLSIGKHIVEGKKYI